MRYARTTTATLTALAAGALLASTATPALAAHGRLTVTGLTVNDRLVTFKANAPQDVLSSVKVTGLAEGEDLQGIDFRPATGLLYGVATTDAGGRVYTIDPLTGESSPTAAPLLPVSGSVSIDVNPRADALRIVDSTGTNLRLRFADNMLFIDGSLNYVKDDVNEGVAPTVGAIAYTNNLFAPAAPMPGTQLFDLDTALSTLALQDPPNAGGLITRGALPQGSKTAFTGFDIYQREMALGGQTWAFVTLTDGGRSTFYEIDLTTGAARTFGGDPGDPASGTVVGGRPFVTDIALAPAQGV